MTLLNYKPETINKETVPSIDNAIESLKKPIEQSVNLSIPSDFNYYYYLKNLDTELEKQQKNLRTIKTWINDCNTQFSVCFNEIITDINDINDVVIKKRDSYIKKVS